MFYKAREKVITLFDDYTAIVSKAKYGAKHRKGLKISNPKQIPIAKIANSNCTSKSG